MQFLFKFVKASITCFKFTMAQHGLFFDGMHFTENCRVFAEPVLFCILFLIGSYYSSSFTMAIAGFNSIFPILHFPHN
ncbi:hypothetical protein BpHYR1_006713 [Brachionus plicatilis]|uniref:Uncharacterized protein n=1 Tax=Brachionus plicatilis TaxID=10195 RepID=A0A3M7RRJ4_BRAPC|nr:hypothetical protein BpHYR1_006713 [Brachionus plicatilis]